jgi:hypothetical protein
LWLRDRAIKNRKLTIKKETEKEKVRRKGQFGQSLHALKVLAAQNLPFGFGEVFRHKKPQAREGVEFRVGAFFTISLKFLKKIYCFL